MKDGIYLLFILLTTLAKLSRTISVAGGGLKWGFASDRPAPKKFATHCAMEVG